jgi:hypothetical protein
MRFFRIYQYLAPLCLLPVAYWLWHRRYEGDHRLVILVLSVPILFAYIIPGIGTNWLRLWEFNTRWKLGRFRPHHGFVFGTATSLFGLLCLGNPVPALDAMELIRAGFVMGSVLAFWNWLYDLYAIKVGFLIVFNRSYRDGRGAAAIATEYCPVFFGAFGVCYGVTIRVAEHWLLELGRRDLYWPLFVGCHLLTLTVPVVAYVLYSLGTAGETGLVPHGRVKDE